jgi:hypothetical protein
MQLDAFLRSADRYAPYASVTVQAAASSMKTIRAYNVLCEEHHGVRFQLDGLEGFQHRTMEWLLHHDRVAFHTDDDVFYRPCHIVLDGDTIVSLRLGANTIWCHPGRRAQRVPSLGAWLWRDGDGDFGYPLSLNGTAYHRDDLLPLLDFTYSNPTEMEAGLAARADRFGPQWMMAELYSCVVSLPHNRVSVSGGARAGSNPEWTADSLLDRYLDGYRLDLDAMDFTGIVGAHQEVPLKFTRP